MTCKNCGYEFEGNFCNNCGQKAKTGRLDWKYVYDEARYVFLHWNGGMLYTTKQLITRPGHSIREYTEGKRVHHYKPLLMLLVIAGFYGFLVHYMDFDQITKTNPFINRELTPQEKFSNEVTTKFMKDVFSHYSLLELLILPFVSFLTWLSFKGWGYNFIEHLVMNAYTSVLRLLVGVVMLPVSFLLQGSVFQFVWSFLGMVLFVGLTFWSYRQFFRERELGSVILRFILFITLFVISIVLFFIAAIIVYFSIFGIPPELMPAKKV